MFTAKTGRRCAKCGHSSKNSYRSFHRFPNPSGKNVDRARKWAVWAYPNENWDDQDALEALYRKGRVLCSAHFKEESFTEHEARHLRQFAVPEDIVASVDEELSASLANSDVPSVDVDRPELLNITPISDTPISDTPISDTPISDTPINDSPTSIECSEPNSTSFVEGRLEPRSILGQINKTRVSDLTKNEQYLYKRYKSQAKEINRLRKKHQNSTAKAVLDDIISSRKMNTFLKRMKPAAATFFKAQLRVSGKKPQGRRWTFEEKLLAITIFKKSPSGYRLLRKLFALPGTTTLNNLLTKFRLRPGINEEVLGTIKKVLEGMGKGDEVCALMFDEMSIKKHLSYNIKYDVIDGFQDHGSQGRSPQVASHAIVFMVAGLRKHWKQPIAHYFSSSAISSTRLRLLLVELIIKLQSINLKVVASISDMGTNNVACYKNLKQNESDNFYNINGEEVAIIYDYPHLLKCFRNMLQVHNLSCMILPELNGQKIVFGTAKWEHLVKLYEVDHSYFLCRRVPKLTKTHIDPQFAQKMRVCYAAQTLSHSSGVAILSYISENAITSEAIATASICLELDHLFDSLNGSMAGIEGGKFLKSRITDKSLHLQFWTEQKERIKSWKFDDINPPSVSGWIATLNGMELVWKKCQSLGFRYLLPRRLNQDALENLFGVLRALCGGNRNPTVPQFEGALKSAIINTVALHDAKSMNCEDDESNFLCNLHTLLNNASNPEEETESQEDDHTSEGHLFDVMIAEIREEYKKKNEEMVRNMHQGAPAVLSIAYVTGFIIRRLLKQRSCNVCLALLTSTEDEVFYQFINYKEYNNNGGSLTRPSFDVAITVGSCATLVDEYLDKKAHLPQVKANIIACLQKNVDFTWLSPCGVHFKDNVSAIINSCCTIWLKWWLTRKNRQLSEEKKSRSLSNRRKYMNIVHL